MKKIACIIFCNLLFALQSVVGQQTIPFDTTKWEIKANAYVLENYKGKDAIYIQQGSATLKGTEFLNGTIEFDVYLTERQSFPGVYFRLYDENNGESFFLRPHLSGKPDANQAAPIINGLTAWQLYFGPSYSFTYDYNFDAWTHVKVVINNSQGQVYLDHAVKPNLSWELKNPVRKGEIAIGGSFAPMHYANFKINAEETTMVDFNVVKREPVAGLIAEWELSDKFEEKLLADPGKIKSVIDKRTWGKKIQVEEGAAANISREVVLNDKVSGNTVFARIYVQSDKDQLKLFEFGYSDRVVVLLNGEALYKGTNRWRSRDYRYLGTIGLFDAVYLNLKKGNNTLLLAVSEDFGGWLVTGKFADDKGISVK